MVLVALAAVAVNNPPFAGVAAGILVVYLLAARLLVHGWQVRCRL